MFDKLHVAEIDVATVVLVKGSNLGHLGIGQSEVEYVEVLFHTVAMCAFRYGHNAALGEPAEGYLGRTLAVAAADSVQELALDYAVNALSAQRPPSHHAAVVLL